MFRIVPKGCVALKNGRTIPEGELCFGKADFYDLSEVTHTISLASSSVIISWKPDPENLPALIRAGDEEGILGKLAAILHADPQVDLRKYATKFGIIITDIDCPNVATEPDESVVIGKRGQHPVRLSHQTLQRDLYIVGRKRTGKSTLLLNTAKQMIESGQGVAVIDPHGDLIDELLPHIPHARIPETIYFNPADREFPIGLNIMEARDEVEQGIVADDILITFKRLSEAWGERMDSILRYTVNTLLRVPGSTFLDIHHLLANPRFREKVVAQLTDEPLIEFWENHYPSLPKDSAHPIISRMTKFMLSPTLNGILGQTESKLNFYDILQNGQILLVDLSEGKIGQDASKLLGSLLVSQLQLAVMRRANLPISQRTPFYLFVDEFQNFTTSVFEKILSEAGKYRLSLTIAHQFISQLDKKMRDAILGNVGTVVMFGLGHEDANYLDGELGMFRAKHLLDLSFERREALCRPSRSADTFMFTTLPPPAVKRSYRQQIIGHSRQAYASPPKPREQVTVYASQQKPREQEATDDDIRPSRRPASRAADKPLVRRTKGRSAKKLKTSAIA